MKVLAGLIISLILAGSAAAYTRITTASTGETPRWPSMPVRYWINERGSSQIANDSEFPAVHAAFQSWQDVSTAAIRFDYRGTTPVRAASNDGVNLISFADDSTPLGSSTLAATFSFFGRESNGTLINVDADIVVNPSQSWSTSGESNRYDIQAVLTHEIGHLLGLDHAGLVSSVMTAFGSPGQVDLRTLQYDDIAGVSEIYPVTVSGIGQIRGFVMNGTTPVFGAHVVAVDRNGTPLVSTLSHVDGSYLIRLLPSGDYRVYAEPLDGPATASNLGGFFTNVSTNFGTTYFPNVSTLPQAQTVVVTPQSAAVTTIQVFPRSATNLNLNRPTFAPRVARQTSTTLIVRGVDLTPGVVFSSSSPTEVSLGGPIFGTDNSSVTPTNASISLTVSPSASLGPRVLTLNRGQDAAVGSGVFVVVDRQPTVSGVSPASGSAVGQVRVVITGSNFRAGARVYFGGIPSADVRLISSTTLDVLTPANVPGVANVQVINSDGTNGLRTSAYTYEVPPPSIASVSPQSGAPATTVTISGANFDTQQPQVFFNGVSSRVITATSAQLVTTVPYGATTGSISVVSFGQTVVGPVFTVIAPVVSVNLASTSYAFVDASAAAGGSNLTFSANDDSVAAVTLPFTFSLFRDIYPAGSQITVATNGFISLEPGAVADFQNGPLPGQTVQQPAAVSPPGCLTFPAETRSLPSALIAPFFDDLAIVPAVSSISTRLVGVAPDRRFIIQWSKLDILDESGCPLNSSVSFQAVLFEGSNDIQFLYQAGSGPRSDGSSATVGLQDSARVTGIQTSFNRSLVRNGFFVTYRFQNGQYTQFAADATPPSAPVVIDGGALTNSTGELSASWTADDPETGIREYQYAIGTTPGSSNVVAFVSTTLSYAVVRPLNLATGTTYYFSVRAVNNDGLESTLGVSDGIQVSPALQITSKVIPYAPHNDSRYTGIALLAPSAMSVVLRAMSDSGTQVATTTVTLNPGQQYARLVSELFGISSFDGWIEIEPGAPGLGVYSATGSWDLKDLDGIVPRDLSNDFVAMHPGAALLLVNPSNQATTATISAIGGPGPGITANVPARGRVRTVLSAVSRITSPLPLAAIEDIESPGQLSLALPETVVDQGSLTFPQGVIGGGYSSTLTLVNAGAAVLDVTIAFGSGNQMVQIPANSSRTLSLAGISSVNQGQIRVDAVRVSAAPAPLGPPPRLLGTVDIENPLNRVSLSTRPTSTEFVFPHVAHGNGYFTGICLITGSSGATITVDVYSAAGDIRRSGTIPVGPNQQVARVITELVSSVTAQTGGYIRIRSTQPILAWEVYGSDEAFASGPPL